jgi:hypothetical protein
MKQKLVTFGDSWPVGIELKTHEKPFGSILANLLEVDCYENYAVAGSSVDALIYQLDQYIKLSDHNDYQTTAVFFITGLSRVMFFDYDGNPVYYKVPPDINHFSKDPGHLYYKYFYTSHYEMFNAQRTLVALQAMCRNANINDFYLPGFKNIDLNFSGIDIDRIYPENCLSLFGLQSQDELSDNHHNPYIYPCHYHPNQLGHEFIATTLNNWIQLKKNTQ